MDGWIKLHRQIQDNGFWTCESFTRGQAWVDLLLLASYTESFFYVRGVKVNLERGQLAWGEVKLSERWKWSRSKLRKFLKDLEKEQQIKQHNSNVIQVITILNYDKYQEKEQQSEQQSEQQKDIYKKVDNNKESKYIYNKSYDAFLETTENKKYHSFVDYLFKANPTGSKLSNVLSLPKQITPGNFEKLIEKHKIELIKEKIGEMENKKDLLKKYNSFYLTLNNWCNK